MSRMDERIAIKKEARARMKEIKFGDAVTNICAGQGNPMRHCYFVRVSSKDTAQCTDGKDHFGDYYRIEVIYQGSLSQDECDKLFEPVWQSEFGVKK